MEIMASRMAETRHGGSHIYRGERSASAGGMLYEGIKRASLGQGRRGRCIHRRKTSAGLLNLAALLYSTAPD